MTMAFLARSQVPRKFDSPEQHLIKGLNVETVAEIFIPPPPWIINPLYSAIQAVPDNDHYNYSASFSLNLAMYNKILVPDDWSDMWFSMNGRVHPYALTWEDPSLWESGDDPEDSCHYVIPALIIRDQSYQP
jgi:hypothetical protein